MANKKALVIYNGIVKQMQSGDTVDPSGLSATAGLWTLNASNWIAASSNYPNVSIPGNFNVDGDMTVTGSMIVNASTLYLGDNQLGNQPTDTQLFVGNITASGPFTISDATSPFVARGTASLDSTLVTGDNITIKKSGGAELLTLIDTGATSVDDANPYLYFKYGANATTLGYLGYGSSSNDDLYLYNQHGDVRLSAGAQLMQKIFPTGMAIYGTASIDGTLDVGGALVGRSTASIDGTLDVGGAITAPSAQITSLDINTATIPKLVGSIWVTGNASIDGTLDVGGIVTLDTVNAEANDVDKFLVASSTGVLTYRTGEQVRSDIGACASPMEASRVSVSDASGYYAGTDVEAVASEIGQELLVHNLSGWEDRSTVALSWNNASMILTASPVNESFYWSDGVRYSIDAPDSLALGSDLSGVWWYYYDGPTLVNTRNPSHTTIDLVIENKALVSAICWNTNDDDTILLANELHGCQMSGATHHYVHDALGAQYKEGGNISGYTLNTNSDAAVSFDLTDIEYYDDDIEHIITDGDPAVQYEQVLTGDAEIPVMYRDAVDGSWSRQAASTLPYIVNGGDTYPSYMNDDGSSWSQVQLGNQKFMLMYLYATNDWEYPIQMIQGSAEYNTKVAALDAVNNEIVNWGELPNPEFLLLYVFVIQAASGAGTKNLQIVEITDYRFQSVSGASAVAATSHSGLTGLGDDDHTHYVLTDGTRTIFDLPIASPLVVDDGKAIIYNNVLGSLGWGVAGGGGGNAASVVTATFGRFLDDVAATNVQSVLDTIDDFAVEVVQGTSEPSSTYAGMVWVDTGETSAGNRSLINDGDGDTFVNCESYTDEDIIRMGADSILIYNASVDSTYPMLQLLPYGHGNVQIAFDAYFDRDTAAWYSCSATANFSIAKNDTQEALQILSNTGDAVGSPIGAFNKTVLKAKASGEVTMPNQPAFLFELASIYQFVPEGINLTIPFNTEIFDQSSDFNTSTYTFTAPVTGRYHLDTCVRPYTVDSECSYIYIQIVTSNRNHSFLWDVANVMNTDGRAEMVLSMMADMDEADTAFVRIRQDNGASQAQINLQTYFGGHLAC